MKVAIVHYWLVTMRGGEKVLEALCDLYPNADIFTHVVDHNELSEKIKRHNIKTTFIGKLPGAKKHYKKYLPFMPMALEQLDLRNYDLVISSEAGPAKGVITSPESVHICYCHSPMRYIWDMYHEYMKDQSWLLRLFFAPVSHYMRLWDYASAGRVDHFVANSQYIAKRIQKIYKRDSTVINPPVAVDDFTPATKSEDYYLVLGQLVPYKRVDLAVKAFNVSGRKLVVIGEGSELDRLKKLAKANISFLGWQSSSSIKDHLAKCKALIFPGKEDFGIVPVEAMASGKPVIAYGRGGALETIENGKTGLFFFEQTSQALNEAIDQFEQNIDDFKPGQIADHACAYSKERFKQRFDEFVSEKL